MPANPARTPAAIVSTWVRESKTSVEYVYFNYIKHNICIQFWARYICLSQPICRRPTSNDTNTFTCCLSFEVDRTRGVRRIHCREGTLFRNRAHTYVHRYNGTMWSTLCCRRTAHDGSWGGRHEFAVWWAVVIILQYWGKWLQHIWYVPTFNYVQNWLSTWQIENIERVNGLWCIYSIVCS